jgi:outer membrane protein assembly factor BamB
MKPMKNPKHRKTSTYLIFFYLSLIFLSCQPSPQENVVVWEAVYPVTTAYSSPRTIDLNKDGILDIVIGTGSGEWIYTDVGVLALDGKTGKRLWHQSARNQVVGSAVFYDITGDGVPEVFIGGRSAELKAINGATGELIWEFLQTDDAQVPKSLGWFNFTTPQLIPDQNGDGYKDLLIANGGDATLRADNPNRPVGKLLIISSKDKKIIAQADMPDGKETYLSPLIFDIEKNNATIIFGTGGETIGGHLYKTTLKDLLNNDISKAKVLFQTHQKGVIAPPVLVDINQDDALDIVQNLVEGKIIAIDGKTNQVLWQVSLEGTEAYNQPAVGFFNEDEIPDFFINFSIGTWPSFKNIIKTAVIDGKTGKFIYQVDLQGNGFSFTSPLSIDLNNDGFSEVLLTFNQQNEENLPVTKLVCIDIKNQQTIPLDLLKGTNWASTPWIGDMDNNGKADIIYLAGTVEKEHDPESAFYSIPLRFNIRRVELPYLKPANILWGSYIGKQYDGIFKEKRKTTQ